MDGPAHGPAIKRRFCTNSPDRIRNIPCATSTFSSSTSNTPAKDPPVSSVTSQTIDINNNSKKCSKAAIAYKDISNQIKQIIEGESDDQQSDKYRGDELLLPDTLTNPTQSLLQVEEGDVHHIISLAEKKEGGTNIFNNMQNLETTTLDASTTDFSFSPNSFLRHFNILSPSQDDAQLTTITQATAATGVDPPTAPLTERTTTLSTQQLNPLEAVVEETVQALDLDWDKSPGNHPAFYLLWNGSLSSVRRSKILQC
jgi:hypothetical protein